MDVQVPDLQIGNPECEALNQNDVAFWFFRADDNKGNTLIAALTANKTHCSSDTFFNCFLILFLINIPFACHCFIDLLKILT